MKVIFIFIVGALAGCFSSSAVFDIMRLNGINIQPMGINEAYILLMFTSIVSYWFLSQPLLQEDDNPKT